MLDAGFWILDFGFWKGGNGSVLRFGRKQLMACKYTRVSNTISFGIPKAFIGLQEHVRGCGVVVVVVGRWCEWCGSPSELGQDR